VILLAVLGAGLALAGLAATYVVYPLVAVLLGRRARTAAAPRREGEPPFVSFLVIAHDEAEAIRSKIENTLALDWPAERFELIVASDASEDGTDEIVAAYPDPRVRLVRNPERGGKTATTALAVAAARGSVLVFSDATGVWNREAIRELAAPLADPTIGAVSGRVTYRYGESQTAQGFRFYQRWVVAQRQAEPAIGGVTSASGSIHALRRDVFEPVPAHLSYDMVVPALCAMHGQRCAYAAGATSLETSRERVREEFTARVRIAVRAYGFLAWLWRERARIRDRRYLVQLFLHKVLRWFSPHLLALLLVSHALLATGSRAAALLLVPHAGLWALAALLAACEGRLRFPGSAPLLLFATVNAAQAVGFWLWLRGARMAAWRPERGAEAGGQDSVADEKPPAG
jgi:cellulose synthase/poly-beta-1,6-N-acetylglucosamine synthase-like glycosyltransferase